MSFFNVKDKEILISSVLQSFNLDSLCKLEKSLNFNIDKIIGELNLDLNAKIIFYVNGYYYCSLNIPKEIVLVNFEKYDLSILNCLKSFVSVNYKNFFLNSLLFNEGCFLYFPSNIVINGPIFIINVFDSFSLDSFVCLNNIYVLENMVNLKIMEYCVNFPKNLLVNKSNFFLLKEKSKLEFCFLNRLNLLNNCFLSFSSIQEKSSVFNAEVHNFSNNSCYSNFNFDLFGRESFLDLKISRMVKLNFVDEMNVFVNHLVKSSKSNINFKGLACSDSKISFKGRINVAKYSSKTDSFLKCDGLLLNNNSSIDLYPELCIENNDVKCQHGATVGSISEYVLYYMSTRGLSEVDSINLIINSFLISCMNYEGCFFSILNKVLLEEF